MADDKEPPSPPPPTTTTTTTQEKDPPSTKTVPDEHTNTTTTTTTTTNNNNNTSPPKDDDQQEEGKKEEPESAESQPPPPPQKPTRDLNYMHRPPRIPPNYGRKPRSLLPKSNVSRVLLYDNVTQRQMLDVKMRHLRLEQRKTGRLMDMHRKSFIVRRLQKQRRQRDSTHQHVPHSLPPAAFPAITASKAREARQKVTKRHRHKEDEGGGRALTSGEDAEGFLPSIPTHQKRHGASTSHGFSHNPTPPHTTTGPHTAATASRALPDLHPHGASVQRSKAFLHVESDASGLTRVLHTFRQPGSGSRGFEPGKVAGGRTTEDERYRRLERLLVRIEPPNEGYMELSPSFRSPRKTMTFTRPSSIHSSLHRDPSSLSPRHVGIGSLLSSVL